MIHLMQSRRFKMGLILLLLVGMPLLYVNYVAKASEMRNSIRDSMSSAAIRAKSGLAVLCKKDTISGSFVQVTIAPCVQDVIVAEASAFMSFNIVQIMAIYCSPDKCNISRSLQAEIDNYVFEITNYKTWREASSIVDNVLSVVFLCTSADLIELPDDQDMSPLQQYGNFISIDSYNVVKDSHSSCIVHCNLSTFDQHLDHPLHCWSSQFERGKGIPLVQCHSYGQCSDITQVEAGIPAQAPAEPPRPDHKPGFSAVDFIGIVAIVAFGLFVQYFPRCFTVRIPEANTPQSTPATSLWSSGDLEGGLQSLSESSSSSSPRTPSWMAGSKGALRVRGEESSTSELQRSLLSSSSLTGERFTVSHGEIEEEEQPVLARYYSMVFQPTRQPAIYDAQEETETEEESQVEGIVHNLYFQEDLTAENDQVEESEEHVAEGDIDIAGRNVADEFETEEAVPSNVQANDWRDAEGGAFDNSNVHANDSEDTVGPIGNFAQEELKIPEEVCDSLH